jgi:hypothetical protein
VAGFSGESGGSAAGVAAAGAVTLAAGAAPSVGAGLSSLQATAPRAKSALRALTMN